MIEILGIKEEFLYLLSPMFHQWRSGSLVILLVHQDYSRLRALVGNWLTWPWKWVLRPYRKIDLFTREIQDFLDCCQVSGPSSCDSSDGCRMNLAARVFQFKTCFRRLVDVTTLLHQVHVSLKKWWNEKSCICGLGPTVWSPQTLTQDINSNGWKHNEAIATQNHLKWWTILKDVNPLNFFVPLPSITWFLHHFCKFHSDVYMASGHLDNIPTFFSQATLLWLDFQR